MSPKMPLEAPPYTYMAPPWITALWKQRPCTGDLRGGSQERLSTENTLSALLNCPVALQPPKNTRLPLTGSHTHEWPYISVLYSLPSTAVHSSSRAPGLGPGGSAAVFHDVILRDGPKKRLTNGFGCFFSSDFSVRFPSGVFFWVVEENGWNAQHHRTHRVRRGVGGRRGVDGMDGPRGSGHRGAATAGDKLVPEDRQVGRPPEAVRAVPGLRVPVPGGGRAGVLGGGDGRDPAEGVVRLFAEDQGGVLLALCGHAEEGGLPEGDPGAGQVFIRVPRR